MAMRVATLPLAVALLTAMTDPSLAQKPQLDQESRDPQRCLAQDNRVHVAHEQGRACIAYRFFDQSTRPMDPVLVVLHGDLLPADLADAKRSKALLANLHDAAQQDVNALRVKILVIERPGTFGSSGDHNDIRKSRLEVALISGAIDILKTKHKFSTFAIAGQSGGAAVAAGILARGRADITCAVLASGRYDLATHGRAHARSNGYTLKNRGRWLDLYNIVDDLEGVAKSDRRQIVLLADTDDQVVPFDGQKQFADALLRKGHVAQFQAVRALDEKRHGLTYAAMTVAARCANERPADMWFSGLKLIAGKNR
jgi:pimeloyl-ACP methyl ester carboxylesterase